MPTIDPKLARMAEEIRELRRMVGELYKGIQLPNQALDATSSPTFANVYSGTYTPTLTGVTNVAASGAFVCQYYRVGNMVTVSGKLDVDPTAAAPTFTEIGVSLPVASNFSAFEQCGGTGSSIQANQSGGFYGDTTNDRASYFFFASSTANATHYFSFSYQVI
jgi:hypothetical protein